METRGNNKEGLVVSRVHKEMREKEQTESAFKRISYVLHEGMQNISTWGPTISTPMYNGSRECIHVISVISEVPSNSEARVQRGMLRLEQFNDFNVF